MLDERRKQYLEAMGLTVWVRRGVTDGETVTASSADDVVAAPEAVSEDPVSPSAPPQGPDSAGLDWDHLRTRVAGCTACELHKTRTQTVFGVGNPDADLMVIGEAPGADEDRQGEPFVGRAGQLLTSMLAAIGLKREQVYIANILKCRPPGNRNPAPAEVVCCMPYLERQVQLVRPRLILSIGAVSAQNLLGRAEPVGRLRGEVHTYGSERIPLVVSYHPAYLLRQPGEKAKAWMDLQRIKRILEAV